MTTVKPRSVPKGKAVFRAVSSDGHEMFRTSARTYTHAVEIQFMADDYWCQPERAEPITPGWYVVSFHGSAASAQRAAGQWKRDPAGVVSVEIVDDERSAK